MLLSRVIILFLIFLTSSSIDALLEPSRREAIIPYLIQSNHPIKSRLDEFFSRSRAIHSSKTLEEAGFEDVRKKWDVIKVLKHPSFPGYIFKTYVDEEPHPPRYKYEENNWIRRIQGAKMIRKAIAKQGLTAQFKVPKKWIYELPEFPKPIAGSYPKYTLVVEEDMDILPKEENHKMWASEQLSTDILDGFKSIIQAVGLVDIKPANQPFCRDGSIAFVDTTSVNKVPIYEKFIKFLSPWHQEYWKSITEK